MSFGFTHKSATFLGEIDCCPRPYIEDFRKCYLDDILIYLTTEIEHDDHVKNVLEGLCKIILYWKTEQWQFGATEIVYLGLIFSSNWIGLESDRIWTIEDWRTPKSIRDVQVLFGLTMFYRRFIRKYVKVMAPISDLLKKLTIK